MKIMHISKTFRLLIAGCATLATPLCMSVAQELKPIIEENQQSDNPPIVAAEEFVQSRLYEASKVDADSATEGFSSVTDTVRHIPAATRDLTFKQNSPPILPTSHWQGLTQSEFGNLQQGVPIVQPNSAIAPSMQTLNNQVPVIPAGQATTGPIATFQDSIAPVAPPLGSGSRAPGSGTRESIPAPAPEFNSPAPGIGTTAPPTGDYYQSAPVTQSAPASDFGGNYFDQGGGYDGGYGDGQGPYGLDGRSINCCGFISDSCSYTIVEALYWQREDGEVPVGNFFRTDDFDFEIGGRFTYGRRYDEMRGWELSYFGFDAMVATSQQADPGAGLIGNLFGTAGGFDETNFTAFRGVQFMDQVQNTNLHSFEANQTWFGWDVAKFFWGVRYISFDDEVRLNTQAGPSPVQFGNYSMDLENRMGGLHIGGELFYDVGYRLSFSFRAKGGVYLNYIDGDTLLFNNGATILANGDDDFDISYSYEVGAFAHYQIMPRMRVIGGVEVLGLVDVATVEDNFNPIITPGTGLSYSNSDDAIFAGFSVGIEIYR